jgi:polyhydroxyalkanoate synthesis regulator protein
MKLSEAYRSIPYDLSGSVSKNRFRQEILWGVSKMFDLFDKPEFCVIFDYKCDIEIHLTDSIEFYQIKSQKAQKPYSFTQLSKVEGTGSVIGKLFVLKDTSCPETRIKCALVSNRFLKIKGKELSDSEVIDFDALDDGLKSIVRNALKAELSRNEVNLSDLHFIYTSMDLISPENAVKGHIDSCFEKIKGCEPIKPNALHRLIFDTVEKKASYEFAVDDLDELIKLKGFTKNELDNMLEQYKEKTDNSFGQIQTYIEENYSKPIERKRLKSALAKILNEEYRSHVLQRIEREISEYIIRKNESGDIPDTSTEELVDYILSLFGTSFPTEYSKQEKYIFILLIIRRWEDGKYE